MKIINEGELLKNTIRGSGLTIANAAKKLGMSRTNLHYYLAKEEFDIDFRQKVRGKLGFNWTGSFKGVKNDNEFDTLSEGEKISYLFQRVIKADKLREGNIQLLEKYPDAEYRSKWKLSDDETIEDMISRQKAELDSINDSLNVYFGRNNEIIDAERLFELLLINFREGHAVKLESKENGIPFYESVAQLTYEDITSRKKFDSFLQFPGIADADFAMRIWGERSVEYPNGSIVICKMLTSDEDWSRVQTGKDYIFLYEDTFLLISFPRSEYIQEKINKEMDDYEKAGYRFMTIIDFNSFPVFKDKIKAVGLVKAVINRVK